MPTHRLHPFTIALHWVVALSILGLSGVGLYMANFEAWALYPWHKSFGVLALIFIVLRLVWRQLHGFESAPIRASAMELAAAKWAHRLLLLLTLLMPVTGMMYSGISGHGFGLFGLKLLQANYAPGDAGARGEVVSYSEPLENLAQALHHWIGYLLIALVWLHIVAALKHHFISRDGVLARMLGRS